MLIIDKLNIATVYGAAQDGLIVDSWPNNSSQTVSTFTADPSTDVCTVAAGHFYPNETRVRLTTTGTLPAGLATGTDYWVIRTGSPGASLTSRLATTRENAQDGVYVDITDAGTGTHSMTPQAVSGSNSYGGGDVVISGLTIENVTGRFLVVRDESGNSGTPVKISGGH